jgi:hypothetical protein
MIIFIRFLISAVAEVRKECSSSKAAASDSVEILYHEEEYSNLTLLSGLSVKEKKTGSRFIKMGFW